LGEHEYGGTGAKKGYGDTDVMVDTDSPPPEEQLLDKEAKMVAWAVLNEIIPSLSTRQKFILRHRIHCEDVDMWTQAEIAKRFKVNQSTIQREEKKLYGYLRENADVQ
jgi:DNA-directed RNA polymerase sigma subunit (sigma70/sigma32)